MLSLKCSDEPIYALGVYFSYNEELATKMNFFDKLSPLQKLLNIWSSRDISIYGRINIVKTLTLSKLTFICSVLNTLPGFTAEVNKIIYIIIFGKVKTRNLKKTTITKGKNEGGLGMIDFSLFDKALKITWVKRLRHALTSTQLAIDKLTCKTVYNSLISRLQCPPTAEKRLIECAFDAQKRQRVYSLPFRVTKEVKLSIFQYKIVHNIL